MFSIIIFQKDKCNVCYKSICQQTYNNYEIITPEKTTRSECYNYAINVAKGDYILFLDEFTYLEENTLEYLNSYDSAYDILIYDIYNHINEDYFEIVHTNPYYTESFTLAKELIKENYFGCVCNKAFKLETLKKYDIRFETLLPNLEDNLFSIMLFSHKISYKWIDTPMCHITKSIEGNRITLGNASAFLKYAENILKIMHDNDCIDEDLILQKKMECLNYRAFRTKDFNKYLRTNINTLYRKKWPLKKKAELIVICILNNLHAL